MSCTNVFEFEEIRILINEYLFAEERSTLSGSDCALIACYLSICEGSDHADFDNEWLVRWFRERADGVVVSFSFSQNEKWFRDYTNNSFMTFDDNFRSNDIMKFTIQNGFLHSINDEPAFHREGPYWVKEWYRDGHLHRDGAPAVETASTKEWYREGQLHRDGAPAKINQNECCWYQNGKLFRDNDLPTLITSDGDQHWIVDDYTHIIRPNDLPNVILADGTQKWYEEFRCQLHRENGPAVIYPNGETEMYIKGERQFD